MSEEESIDLKEAIDKNEIARDCVKELCESKPFWSTHPECWEWSDQTDYIKTYYMTYEMKDHPFGGKCKDFNGVRWDRIHGWKRKVLKTYIHNEIKRKTKQMETFNKYIGRDDVLYVHARIGGGNWPNYYEQVIYQPWFIEKVDDSFDSTYCDIYAKIDPNTVKKLEENKDE